MRVLDLYAGVGLFSAYIGTAGAQVIAIGNRRRRVLTSSSISINSMTFNFTRHLLKPPSLRSLAPLTLRPARSTPFRIVTLPLMPC